MKGITKQLRELTSGEQVTVTGVERSDIHHIATRVGIKVKCEKFAQGFLVTRVDKPISPIIRSVPVVIHATIGNDIEPIDSAWIEDRQTFENGEILYWHHRPKEKPVCYRRESDLSGA